MQLEKSYVEGPQRRWLAGTEKSRGRLGSGGNGEADRSKIPQGHTGMLRILVFILRVTLKATLSRNTTHATYMLNFLLSSSYKKVNINR